MIRARRKIWLWLKLVAFGLLFGLISGACSRSSSLEDMFIERIDRLARLAETKELDLMMTYFSEDFIDFEGRTKEGLRSLLEGYLGSRTAIVVHRLTARVETLDVSRAVVETEVAVSSGRAEALRRLVRIAPDLYRIRIRFGRVGEEWRIQSAAWTSLELGEFLPESLALLKKIFPSL